MTQILKSPFKQAKFFLLLTACCFTINSVQAQTGSDNTVFSAVEQQASFPGGLSKFSDYLATTLRYPAKAREANIQGKVFLTFVVEKNGGLTDIRVLRGLGNGCDEEAIRVLKASPKWIPGQQNGEVVREQFTLPVSFRVNDMPSKVTPAYPGTTFSSLAANDSQDEVFTAVDHSASFPGGMEEFTNYLAKNLKYPETALKNNMQGKVFLTFVVEKDGSISNMRVLRGVGSGCDEEAVRVIAAGPKWHPGSQNGNVVREQYTVPINFTLDKK